MTFPDLCEESNITTYQIAQAAAAFANSDTGGAIIFGVDASNPKEPSIRGIPLEHLSALARMVNLALTAEVKPSIKYKVGPLQVGRLVVYGRFAMLFCTAVHLHTYYDFKMHIKVTVCVVDSRSPTVLVRQLLHIAMCTIVVSWTACCCAQCKRDLSVDTSTSKTVLSTPHNIFIDCNHQFSRTTCSFLICFSGNPASCMQVQRSDGEKVWVLALDVLPATTVVEV